jgi:hypothetical protein
MVLKKVLVRQVTSIKKTTEHNIKVFRHTFHGQHQSGEWRVKHNGKNALVSGVVSELIPSRFVDGKQKYTKKLVDVTNGFIRGKEGEISFIAKCESSQKLYRVIGQLKYCLTTKQAPVKPAEIDPIVEASVPVPSVESTQQPELKEESIAPPDLKLAKEQKKLERLAREEAKFNSLNKTIEALVAAGQDPLIPISYFIRISNLSRATVYRMQGTILPKFIKLGKSSFLHLSDFENFKAERPPVNRNQTESKHSSTTVGLVQQAA